ncbi:hypothetical protein G7Z17_g2424 [Cylindrodendrum hubeiense]|uniref:Uncharacterized protein n=1 Tax=Cylindrodendrum hubeiense TaxID=595255 RepID=A0A9P5HHK5_9HYPO|nr:hypothetical protein G7Z17_g2424 [Cylindrodendrum hubeiense]
MIGSAKSKSEADSQIEHLRKKRGVNRQDQHEPDCLASMLDNSLQTISDQLYQNRSHFLLELIQNADDNTFAPKVIPSLSFTLSSVPGSQHLRTDCNEVGFTFEDVNSISHSGESTKKRVMGGQRGYIGEKGIGFKSVFKAADVVNIASGYYEFKFERNRFLGMVIPIPSPFPSGQRLLNHTQFLLNLRGDDDFKKIQDDLHNIEPQLLIFLRRIREFNIQTSYIKKRYRVDSDISNAVLGEVSTISSQRSNGATKEKKYLVTRQKARGLPIDPQRQGVTTSEVVLAFPINDSDSLGIGTQKVFAFLPIDDFGFKFLIHADFLLVASREGLDYDSAWNLALRNAIQQAFITAIKRFMYLPADQSGQGLRYGWPKYIKHHQSSQEFWNKLGQATLHDLRIKLYTPRLVCDLILDLHDGHPSSVANRTPEDLVKDAAYVFKYRNLFEREGAPKMYFLVKNQGSSSRRNNQIYIVDDASVPNLVDKYKDTPNTPFYILDELYENVHAEEEVTKRAFHKWLLHSKHISAVPILIRNHHPTAEWDFLQKAEVADLLRVVEQACKNTALLPQLLRPVSNLQVACLGREGRLQPLAELAIPTTDLLRACPHIAFANLPNPDTWKFLNKFGVPTTPNTTARLRELNALVSRHVELVDKDIVHECYRGLSRSPEQDKRIIL